MSRASVSSMDLFRLHPEGWHRRLTPELGAISCNATEFHSSFMSSQTGPATGSISDPFRASATASRNETKRMTVWATECVCHKAAIGACRGFARDSPLRAIRTTTALESNIRLGIPDASSRGNNLHWSIQGCSYRRSSTNSIQVLCHLPFVVAISVPAGPRSVSVRVARSQR